MKEPPKERSTLEKVNLVIRVILLVGTVGILIVAAIAMVRRGTGY
jgi:hypothetical protein